jgi:hypothetical protein
MNPILNSILNTNAATLTAAPRQNDESYEQYTYRRKFAQMVLDAKRMHEHSYDKAAADKATAEFDAACSAFGMLDYEQFYTRSWADVCEQSATDNGLPYMAYPIYLILSNGGNDAENWAVCLTGLHEPHLTGEEAPAASDDEIDAQ